MASHNTNPFLTMPYIPVVENFLGRDIGPVPASSAQLVNNYTARENSKQLIIGSVSTTSMPYLPDFGFLEDSDIRTIHIHTWQLLLNIQRAISQYQSLVDASYSPANYAHYLIRNHCRNDLMLLNSPLTHCVRLIHKFFAYPAPRSTTVQALQRELQGQLELLVLSLCRIFSMSRHDQSLRDETWLPTQEIQNFYQQMDLVVRELLDCVSLCTLKTFSIQILNGSRGVVDLPIKLLDASQSLILIPPDLCTSKQKFHDLLRIILRRQPWHGKVDQEEYVLEDKELTTDIGTENWHTKVLPGAEIFMTLILKHEGAVSDTCCPRCRAINIVKISNGKRVKCRNCHVISNIVETNRVVELPGDHSESPTKEQLLENAFRIRYLHEKPLTPTSRRTFSDPALTYLYSSSRDFISFALPQQSHIYYAQLLQYNKLITPSRGGNPQIPPTISATQAAPRSRSSSRSPLRNAFTNKKATGKGYRNS